MTRALVLMLLAACTSPEEEAANALGPEVGEQGPEHRPGQPCLVCHSEKYDRGEQVFVLAGTVYRDAGATLGERFVRVDFIDLDGRPFFAETNLAGNFMISIGDTEEDVTEGWKQIDFEPHFPVRVAVTSGGFNEPMRSDIPREGSCAACHTDPADEDSAGKVVLQP